MNKGDRKYVVKNVMVLKRDTSSVRELVAWVNENIAADISELSELKSGSIYCQFMHKLFPSSISLSKVHLLTNVTFEIEANFKLLRSTFEKLDIRKDIPYRELVKGRGHYEFINWLKKFHDVNYNGRFYDASDERNGKPIGLRRVVEKEKRIDYSNYFRHNTTISSYKTDSNSLEVVPRTQSLVGISETPLSKGKEKNLFNLPNDTPKLATESPKVGNKKMGTKMCPDARKAPIAPDATKAQDANRAPDAKKHPDAKKAQDAPKALDAPYAKTVVNDLNSARLSNDDCISNACYPPLSSESDTEDVDDDRIWEVRRQIALLKDKLSTIRSILFKYKKSPHKSFRKLKRYLRKEKMDEPFVLRKLRN